LGKINLKLLIVDSEDWTFWFHRLSLAITVKANGFDVTLLTRCNEYASKIRERGINVSHVDFVRSTRLPIKDIINIYKLHSLFKLHKPSIIHNVALKTILISSLAALLSRKTVVVNAFTGLGYVFSSEQLLAKTIRLFIKPVFKYFATRPNFWSVFQNPDDMNLFIKQGMAIAERSVLIRGSGVDTEEYTQMPDNNDVPIVMLASRMLWDKGIGEFIEASKKAYENNINAKFVLVGDVDPENPMSIPEATLNKWASEGFIEWRGHCANMPEMLGNASIVCLPSYREGLPKVLLEAAAVGRPLIATDVPGCREIVRNNENGILVKLKDVDSLYRAIEFLVQNKKTRLDMGAKSRVIVETELSNVIINRKTIDLYNMALENI